MTLKHGETSAYFQVHAAMDITTLTVIAVSSITCKSIYEFKKNKAMQVFIASMKHFAGSCQLKFFGVERGRKKKSRKVKAH